MALPSDCTIHDVRRTVADALLRRIWAEPWVVLSRDRHGRPLRVAFVLAEVLAYNRRAIGTGRRSGGLRSA